MRTTMKTATIEARDWADRNSSKLLSYIRRLLNEGNDKVLVYDCGKLLFAAYAGDKGQLNETNSNEPLPASSPADASV